MTVSASVRRLLRLTRSLKASDMYRYTCPYCQAKYESASEVTYCPSAPCHQKARVLVRMEP